MPTNAAKVSTQITIAAPLVVILVWIFGSFGIVVPAEVSAAIAALFTALFGAFAPDPD